MIPDRRKPLTAAQQFINLKGNPLSAGAGELRAGRLHWRYDTSPAPLSRSYGIRIEFANGGTPEVFVERPDLEELAEGRKLPHVYQQKPARLSLSSGHRRVAAVDAHRSDDRAVDVIVALLFRGLAGHRRVERWRQTPGRRRTNPAWSRPREIRLPYRSVVK